MQRTVQPTGQERTFGADELIVSKTDPRGVITYANDVFLRVSGYGHADITGLSQMAEKLRSEATGFLAEMRR
jgi:hypothetical protein